MRIESFGNTQASRWISIVQWTVSLPLSIPMISTNCEQQGILDSGETIRLNSRREYAEKTAFTGGSCFVTTRWWNKDVLKDGTQAQSRSNHGSRRKSLSDRKTSY